MATLAIRHVRGGRPIRLMLAVFLGAGFSRPGGVPLARQLFDSEPRVDRITRQRLVERVLAGWRGWHRGTGGQPEEYLAELQSKGGRQWQDAVWYVGLAIALQMGRVQIVGAKPTITRHNIDRTSGVPEHEAFWSTLFRRRVDVAVLTTNYDVLAERGIRHLPRLRIPRPGFHYGFGPEHLAGGGYPSYSHIQKISTGGAVPLLKLHGSISWSVVNDRLVKYHDCRPAIKGNPAIVAPVTQKTLPHFLADMWRLAADLVAKSGMLIVVGYSLPVYDQLIRDLLRRSVEPGTAVHVFDPDPAAAARFQELMPSTTVAHHPGFPDATRHLARVLDANC
jgi:hypothetical protein